MKTVFLIGILASLTGCRDISSSAKFELDEEFEINYGEQVTLKDEGITLRFSELIEDSRCPKGVKCFWAGNAEVTFGLNGHEFNLNTYISPKDTTISEYHIELIALDPYPVHQVEIPPKEYIARVLIIRN